jgi:LacI family transcriptional regulator
MDTYTSLNPTIRDVALKAKVSVATVSRALNEPDSLRPETLGKVQEAIEKLQYRRNDQARGLKAMQSLLVGIVIPDILNPFFARVVRGAEALLSQNEFTTIICDSEESPAREQKYLSRLLERRVQGLIFIPALEKCETVDRLSRSRLPVVYVDRYFSNDCDSVKGNNYSGISLLVTQLVQEGYRRIAAIAGPLDTLPGRERFDAFRRVAENHGLQSSPEMIRVSDFTIEGGYRSMMALLRSESPPEAVVVHNNTMAIGALRAIRELGLKIPGEIAISAFDEVSLAELVDPSLTIVVQPAEEMGRAAAKILIDRIAGGMSQPTQEIVFEPKLIVGGSTRSKGRDGE